MLVRGIFFAFTYVLSLMSPSTTQAEGQSGGYYFLGRLDSHAEYEPWDWRANATLQFFFKTWRKSNMMVFYQDEKTYGQHIDLFLLNGKPRLRVRIGQDMDSFQTRFITGEVDFADSGWHEVKIELSDNEIRFHVNSTEGKVYSAEPIPYTEYIPASISRQNIASLQVAGLMLEWSHYTTLMYPSIFSEIYGKEVLTFEGCIGNIRFNRIPNGPLERARLRNISKEAMYNCTGACAARPQRCANRGRCVDHIKYSECDCTGIGYEGGSCEKSSTTAYNKHKGYMSYSLDLDSPLLSTERNTLEFMFLTNKATDGVFFFMGGNQNDHLLVELVNGRVRAQANVGGDTIEVRSSRSSLNDSCWHFVEVKRRRSRLTLIVDKERTSGNSSYRKFKELNLQNHSNVIYFGGGPAGKLQGKSKSKTLSFNGYLRKFRFEGMDVLDNALSNVNGFSSTEAHRITRNNFNLGEAEKNCEPDDSDESGDCTSDDDDTEICTTSTPTPTAERIEREPETSTTSAPSASSSDPPDGPKTQAVANAKLRNPTPRPRGVSAWVIILIVLGAMAIVFIAVFLLYRWNHRYSGSFKPSKNEEGQTKEPGSDTTEQQFRTYNQPAFFVKKPPKKPTADSPVSI